MGIKTTVRTRGQGAWLPRLLGYLLLDYENDHAIKRASFLFPRRQTAVDWSVTRLISSLPGRTDLALADLHQGLRDRLDRKTGLLGEAGVRGRILQCAPAFPVWVDLGRVTNTARKLRQTVRTRSCARTIRRPALGVIARRRTSA
ncbi:MAG: hypothetical protein OXC11_01265 [Rhodospirillales bacterium]|nr:hypothetical protein [Rhodospirillales bacterium]